MNNPPSVLIVDDEEDVAEVYALDLADEYDVSMAHSGRTALEQIDESMDVVLLDRRMPGMDGDEVLEEIRERDLDVRVAMVTAVDPGFDIADMGFDAYLVKPVDAEDLHSAVEELLSLSRYDDQTRELFTVAEKLATLKQAKHERDLKQNEEYAALKQRQAELNDQTAARIDDENHEFFRKALDNL